MKLNKSRKIMLVIFTMATIASSGALLWGVWSSPAPVPEKVEYVPVNQPVVVAQPSDAASSRPSATNRTGVTVIDLGNETVGAAPKAFVPAVGNWVIGQDDDTRVLVVDGRKWSRGQTASGIADRARTLYGERYAEFLDNVQSFAYFPYAIAVGIEDFRQGEIVVRFKGIDGRIDQAAGILFDLKPNGDYLALRANPLENNLVLWQFYRGKRSSVKWIKNTPTPSKQWHALKLVVSGTKVEGYLNGQLYLTHTLPQAVSGRVGLWSKADSVVYFDDYKVALEPRGRH
jgi:hypothetical protein